MVDDLKEMKRILEIERGDSGSHSMESLLCKSVWTCHKTDYLMNESVNQYVCVFMIYSSE
jgi:hypothetical protein